MISKTQQIERTRTLEMPMPVGASLHEFELALADYLCSNFHNHTTERRFRQALEEEDLPAALLKQLTGKTGEYDLLLSDSELLQLEEAAKNLARPEKMWSPYPELHRRHVRCIPEIRMHLSKETAEDWAAASQRFSARLQKKELLLHEGVSTVAEWIWALRELLRAMTAAAYLPVPEGMFPTPTASRRGSRPQPASEPLLRPGGLADQEWDDIRRMREAIAETKDGKDAKVISLIKKARIGVQRGRKALRWLAENGEYHGHYRPPPHPLTDAESDER